MSLRTRIGILSFSLAFALLTGNPIAGALLAAPRYVWRQPMIFAAVRIITRSPVSLMIEIFLGCNIRRFGFSYDCSEGTCKEKRHKQSVRTRSLYSVELPGWMKESLKDYLTPPCHYSLSKGVSSLVYSQGTKTFVSHSRHANPDE